MTRGVRSVVFAPVALMLAASLPASAFTGAVRVDLARVRSLEAQPKRIELANRFASAQLVVSARLDDDALVDVTRDAQVIETGGLIEVSERGRVRPLRDGDGRLA